MSQFNLTKKPSWYAAEDISASSRGWVYDPTGEVLVACRGLDTKNTDAASAPTFTAAIAYSGTAAMVTDDIVTITITSTEAVKVSSIAYVVFNIDTDARQAVFDPATSTGTSLKFKYTIDETDSATAGQVSVGTTIVGTVSDLVGDSTVPVAVTFVAPNTSTATVN